jgi:hypothetical protein
MRQQRLKVDVTDDALLRQAWEQLAPAAQQATPFERAIASEHIRRCLVRMVEVQRKARRTRR